MSFSDKPHVEQASRNIALFSLKLIIIKPQPFIH